MESPCKIEERFGPHALGDGLFYTIPGGLRFALSEGEAPLDQVLKAMFKALPVCKDVFAFADTIDVCCRKYLTSKFAARDTMRELALAGINIPSTRAVHVKEVAPNKDWPDDGRGWWAYLHFTLPKAKLPNLLWCAFAGDFAPMHPNPGCKIYLTNIEDGVLIHPYDDRGMDIIGPNTRVLESLFETYSDCFLDFDREAMNDTFAPANRTTLLSAASVPNGR